MEYEKEIVLFVIVGSVMFFLLGTFMISFLIVYQKRQIRFFEEKQALKASYEQEILKSQLETQNQTLKYIGQELHDNLGQLMALVRLNLSVLSQEPLPVATKQRVDDTKEIVKNAIADLRSMSKSLDESFLNEFGLVESITNELDRIQRTGRFETRLTVQGRHYSLDKRHEIILFRLTQEALTNAIKHSSASRLEVTAEYCPDCFKLNVLDNGVGFECDTTIQQGSGLRNFRNRTNLIGGECQVLSKLHQGTQVQFRLPFSIPLSTIS